MSNPNVIDQEAEARQEELKKKHNIEVITQRFICLEKSLLSNEQLMTHLWVKCMGDPQLVGKKIHMLTEELYHRARQFAESKV